MGKRQSTEPTDAGRGRNGGNGAPGAALARRLERAERTIADLAKAQADLQCQIDDVIGTLERTLAVPAARAASKVAPARRVGRPEPGARRWMRPAARAARAGIRATLGVARKVWDAAHPDPPWKDQVSVVVGEPTDRLPRLALAVELRDPSNAESASRIRAMLDRQTDSEVTIALVSREAGRAWPLAGTGATLGEGLGLEAWAREVEADFLWRVTPSEIAAWSRTQVETVRLSLAIDPTPLVRVSCERATSSWIVRRSLWRPDTDFDHEALRRRRADGDDVVARALDLGARYRLGDGDPFHGLGESAPTRVDAYWVTARPEPRAIDHTVHPLLVASPGDASKATGSRLLIITAIPLFAGWERVIVDTTRAHADEAVVITVVAQPGAAADRWRALADLAPCFDLSSAVPAEVLPETLVHLAARWSADRLLWLGDPARGAAALGALRAQGLGPIVAAGPTLTSTANVDRVLVGDADQPRRLCEASGEDGLADGAALALPEPEHQPSEDADGRAWRLQRGFEEDVTLVVAPADLVVDERPDDVVRLAALCRDQEDLVFVLAGDGPLAGTVDDLVRLLPPCRVVVAAGVPRAVLLGAADIVLLAGEHTDVDGRLRSAREHRRRVIATDVGDRAERWGDDPGVTVVPVGDLEAAASAIREFATAMPATSDGPAATGIDGDERNRAWRQALERRPSFGS